MTVNETPWAELAKTPSGALTAESKRIVERERQQAARQRSIDWARREARSEVLDRLIAASEQMDSEHGEESEPETTRENRIDTLAYDRGLKDGGNEAKDEANGTFYGILHDALYRLDMGLDAGMTPRDLLERMLREVGE